MSAIGVTVNNRVDENVALANSQAVNARIAQSTNAEDLVLPAGEITLQTPPVLKSNTHLRGHPQGTTIRLYHGNDTPIKHFSGIGYTRIDDVQRPLRVGELMFEFRYYETYHPEPADGLGHMVRRVKVATVGDGVNTFTTTPARNQTPNSLICYQRFWNAWACGQLKAGALSCTVAEPAGIVAGMYLWLTDGPVANAGQGHFRKVDAVEKNTVWFTTPIPRDFGPALLADIQPLVNATISDLRVDPGNYLWSIGYKGTVGCKLENLDCGSNYNIISTGQLQLLGCRGGAYEFNTATETILRDCQGPYFYTEEGSSDISVYSSTFGPSRRGHPQNCVTIHYFSDRIKFRQVTVQGAGQIIGGAWPTNSFNVTGKDHDFDDIEIRYPQITNGNYPWAAFGGEGLQLSRLKSENAPLQISQGTNIFLDRVRGPYIQILKNTKGVAAFCDPLDILGGEGWQTIGVASPSRKDMQSAASTYEVPMTQTSAIQEPPRPLFRHTQNAQPGNLPPTS